MFKGFKIIVAMWFVVQIALPFMAPLQACDLGDLLGTTRHHDAASPDASITPLPTDAESEAKWFLSPIEASTLRASTALVGAGEAVARGPLPATLDGSVLLQLPSRPIVLRV